MEAIKKFANDHPQITSWIVLAIGMVIILVWSASDVGFTSSQWTALIVTTILLAGACVWIIGWEDDEDDFEEERVTVEEAQTETKKEEV
ncbi:MAG TPA: hypothetical protein PKE64_07855 [Anaerolineae bacterium]|nr:hypothetical protein [Anaerolineae bacterium]HMR63908.1 hypothetical protein [Anaerolineae bacterium]